MPDISRSMSKANTDLVSNFLSTLTNLVKVIYFHCWYRWGGGGEDFHGGGEFIPDNIAPRERGGGGGVLLHRRLNIWCNNPSFSFHPRVVAEVVAAEAAQVITSSSNLLNDTQYQVLPSQNPGLELTMLSGDPLHCVFPVAPPEGGRPERVKTPCVQSPPEGEKTLCVQPPPEGGKDSVCTVPTTGGENSVCTFQGYIQTSSVQKCIFKKK